MKVFEGTNQGKQLGHRIGKQLSLRTRRGICKSTRLQTSRFRTHKCGIESVKVRWQYGKQTIDRPLYTRVSIRLLQSFTQLLRLLDRITKCCFRKLPIACCILERHRINWLIIMTGKPEVCRSLD